MEIEINHLTDDKTNVSSYLESLNTQLDTPPETPATLIASHDEIAAHIESILRNIIKAINAKHFNQALPPWDHVAADYRIDCPHNPWQQTNVANSAWIQSLEDFSIAYPDAHITIDCLMASVSRNSGHARAFMECRVTGGPGFPSGRMSKPAMSMHEFEFMASTGKWMFVRETTVSGAPVCVPLMDGEVSVWGGG